jgi:uncharacterized coiled-coil DUF342 family protein
MSVTKEERIANIETQIAELAKQRKNIIQAQKAAERKARTHRLCKRGGEIEKNLPGIETLTEDEFKAFANITFLTPYSKGKLAGILADKVSVKPVVEVSENTEQEAEDSEQDFENLEQEIENPEQVFDNLELGFENIEIETEA